MHCCNADFTVSYWQLGRVDLNFLYFDNNIVKMHYFLSAKYNSCFSPLLIEIWPVHILTSFVRSPQQSYLMLLAWVIFYAAEVRVCLWFTELVSGLRNLRDILRQFLSTARCSRRTAVRPPQSSESGQFTSCSWTLWHTKHALLTAPFWQPSQLVTVFVISAERRQERTRAACFSGQQISVLGQNRSVSLCFYLLCLKQ